MIDFPDRFLKSFYSFNRPFHEVQGYYFKHVDDFDYLYVNALGLDPKDIRIEISEERPRVLSLRISGKTHDEVLDEDFDLDMTFDVYKPITKVTKSSVNGLLVLKIEYEKPAKPKVEIVEG